MEHCKSIKSFYAGKSIFVTGGSGYMGKALIEKLLRSCPDITCIYVLLRSKKGVPSDDRLELLKRSQIFDRVRVAQPDALNKLRFLNGDVTVDNLGLSPLDEETLKNQVNIVFHCAATVAFNNPIKIAINTNVLGTKRVLDVFREAKQLTKFVYVSTAYSNPREEFIEEKVYKSLHRLDIDWYVKCADVLPAEIATEAMHQIHVIWRRLSKFMTEQLVEEYRTQFGVPALIVRPSVVGPAYKEPFPGWADSYIGLNGAVIEVGRGTLSSMPFNPSALIDLVPLDIACDYLIVAAWFDTMSPKTDIRIVNCTSGSNGISYLELVNLVVKHSREYPSKYTMLYPNTFMPDNAIVHRILEALHATVPAHMTDLGLRLMGKRPMAVKILNTVKTNILTTSFVSSKTFHYSQQSVEDMLQAVAICEDSEEFNIDCGSIIWDEYIKRMVLGLQKYILKSDESLLAQNRRTLKGLYAAWCLYYGSMIALTGYAFYNKSKL